MTTTFSHCQSNIDSLHNDHSAICTTFHNCIDLKTPGVNWNRKQLMIFVHVTSSAKGHSMQSLLEKPTSIRSAYLFHTRMHISICMHTCSCMPTALSPSPSPSPLAHSNHHTFPYPNALVLHVKPCQCVGAWYMYVHVHACVCVTKGRLKACICLHVSVYMRA